MTPASVIAISLLSAPVISPLSQDRSGWNAGTRPSYQMLVNASIPHIPTSMVALNTARAAPPIQRGIQGNEAAVNIMPK